jgi:predicted nucleic acid-binding protein
VGHGEAVLSEAFHLLGERGTPQLAAMLQRRALTVAFELGRNPDPVIKLMKKYSAAPMSLADACLVRMSETLANPVILTTDADFRAYRRHGRPVVPCVIPKKEVALQYSTGLNWDEVENRTL